MPQRDSVSKIIQRYFWAFTTEEFTFEKKVYEPKRLIVSPTIFFKRMECLANCGACCTRFTLDYLPSEKDLVKDALPQLILSPREIFFNGRSVTVLSDTQEDCEDEYFCKHLRKDDGRCGIHLRNPLSCDFELLRVLQSDDPRIPSRLQHRPFSRGWKMKKLDGTKGAICRWYDAPGNKEWNQEVIRRLLRLKDWTDHFGIETHIPKIINWVQSGPYERSLILNQKEPTGFGLS